MAWLRATSGNTAIAQAFKDAGRPLCGTDVMRLTDLGPGTVYPGLVRLEIHQIIKETSQDRLKNGPDGYQRYWYELADSAAADRLIARREKLATRRGPVQISLPAYQTG